MKRSVKITIASMVLFVVGVAYQNHVEADAGRGFLGGLFGGGLIGGAVGGAEGAAIGSAIGATTGAAIGAAAGDDYYRDDSSAGVVAPLATGLALGGIAAAASRRDRDDYRNPW